MVVDEVAVGDLDAGGALVAFGDLRRVRDRAERDIFLLAAHFADLYHVDTSRPDDLRTLPGAERGIRVAGEGTPLVLEFAVAEMAAELALTCYRARRLIGDALETRHRLPLIWARVVAGEVPVWIAQRVAQATRSLTRAQAAFVDAELVEYADGRLPFGRFAELLEGTVIAADPGAAAAREQAAAAQRFAKVGQSNEHGQKTLYVKTSAAEMARIDATLAYLADALEELGDPDNEDRRRTKAMLIMANPGQALALLQAFAATRAQTGSGAGAGQPPWSSDDTPLPGTDEGEPSGEAGSTADDIPGARPRHGHGGDAHGADDGAAPAAAGGASGDGAPPGTSGGDPTGPAAPFLTPFRPGDVPACPCRGGRFTYDTTTLLPQVVLYLHLHADTLARGNGVARWEGEGPISALYVRDFLGPHARFVVKPVIDPATLAPVDSYEIPDRHREALHLRTPADVFPYAPNTSRKKQGDHTKRYVPLDQGGKPGQTSLDNLGPMTGFHHRVKTHAGWQVEQPFPGIYLWRSPHGSIFLVDHTGTRQIRRPRATGEQDPGRAAEIPQQTPPAPTAATVAATPEPPQSSALETHFRALIDAA